MYRRYSSVALNELFVVDTNDNGTRSHSCKLIKARYTRDIVKFFFSNKVINRWNDLDQRAVDAPSINAFKVFGKGQEQPDGLLYGLVRWALGLTGRWLVSEAVHGSYMVSNCCYLVIFIMLLSFSGVIVLISYVLLDHLLRTIPTSGFPWYPAVQRRSTL